MSKFFEPLLTIFGIVAVLLSLVALYFVAFVWGVRLIWFRPKKRRWGYFLVIACLLAPPSCWYAPDVSFWMTHRRSPWKPTTKYPHGITEGMTTEEVRSRLGEPHKIIYRKKGDGWYYYTDVTGSKFYVSFDANGKVWSRSDGEW
jgi:hypothetical protein